jgi:hypothetical protein
MRPNNGSWQPVYVVVFDSKYTKNLRPETWSKTDKYLRIRSTHDKKQKARQLWLAAPQAPGIRPEDEAIEFSADGTNLEPAEVAHIGLGVTPSNPEVFLDVAKGLTSFFIQNFLS